jgi:hypothetical protein
VGAFTKQSVCYLEFLKKQKKCSVDEPPLPLWPVVWTEFFVPTAHMHDTPLTRRSYFMNSTVLQMCGQYTYNLKYLYCVTVVLLLMKWTVRNCSFQLLFIFYFFWLGLNHFAFNLSAKFYEMPVLISYMFRWSILMILIIVFPHESSRMSMNFQFS